MQKGYTLIQSTHAILGTGTDRITVIKGGSHPKMRLLVKDNSTVMNDGEGLTGEYSFSLHTAHNTSAAVLDVVHKDGSVAGRSVTSTAVNELNPFAPVATTDEPIFEADEDVCLVPSTVAGNAADASLVVLKFEVVN